MTKVKLLGCVVGRFLTLEFFQPHTTCLTQKLTAYLTNEGQETSFRTDTLSASHANMDQAQAFKGRAVLADTVLAIALVSMSTHRVSIQTATIFGHKQTSYPCPSFPNTRDCSRDYVVLNTNTFNKNHISGLRLGIWGSSEQIPPTRCPS